MNNILKFCFSVFISFQLVDVFGQCTLPACRSISASSDTSICLGDNVTLKAQGADGNYKWTSLDAGATIVTPNNQTTQVNFSNSGIFRFVVSGEPKPRSVATDGNFDLFNDSDNFNPIQPNRTFETAYGIALGGPPTGLYITSSSQFRVDDTIIAFSSNSFWCIDSSYWHKVDPFTGKTTSRGKIFYADGADGKLQTPYTFVFGNANPLWRLSNRPVQPNTSYMFTVDISNWNNGVPSPEIMLLVNGVALNNITVYPVGGTISTGPDGSKYYQYPANDFCTWRTVTGTWNSGSNTTATIAIAEVSNVLMGHELALDDISFSSGIETQRDTVTVTVDKCTITGLSTVENISEPTIYPNPTSGYAHVKSISSGTITIYNMLGIKVSDFEIDQENRINLESLSKGVYLYQLNSEGYLSKGTLFMK